LGSLVYELKFILDHCCFILIHFTDFQDPYLSNRDLKSLGSDIPLLVLVPLCSIYTLMVERWLVALFGWNHWSMVQSLYLQFKREGTCSKYCLYVLSWTCLSTSICCWLVGEVWPPAVREGRTYNSWMLY